MLKSNKKSQISIESLIVLSVLIIGGVVFGYVFLGNIRNQTETSDELSSITDSFLNEFGNELNPSQTDFCNNNGVCEPHLLEAEANCNDCVLDPSGCDNDGFCELELGETEASCEDCDPAILTFEDFELETANPVGDSEIDSEFGLKARVVSSYSTLQFFNLFLEKKDASGTWIPSNKCSIKGSYPNTSGLYELSDSLVLIDTADKIHELEISDISCSNEGEYRFSGSVKPVGTSVSPLSETVTKNIILPQTETRYSLMLKISEPQSGNTYSLADTLSLNSEVSLYPESSERLNLSCVWQNSEGVFLSDSCTSASVPASVLGVGSHKIEFFVTVNLIDDPSVRPLFGKAEINVRIIPSLLNDGQLYLSVPGRTYVKDIFNISVYANNPSSLDSITDYEAFSFSSDVCSVLNRDESLSGVNDSEVIELTSGAVVYYKEFLAECLLPVYESCPDTLSPITVSVESFTEEFTSEFDFRSNGTACTTSTDNAVGTLNVCVFEDYGLNFSDICDGLSSNDGVLKLELNDFSENTVVDETNGTLKIYIK